MKVVHVASMALSCVAIGVLLTLLVQHKMNAGDGSSKTHSVAVLNPSTFSAAKSLLGPALVTTDPKREESGIVAAVAPVSDNTATTASVDTTTAKAPVGSGKRWTPLK
ncbi:unnamed protein product [Ectocarpus sp. 6 AP-2014]